MRAVGAAAYAAVRTIGRGDAMSAQGVAAYAVVRTIGRGTR
jgi:hypothetical protein